MQTIKYLISSYFLEGKSRASITIIKEKKDFKLAPIQQSFLDIVS